MRSTPSAGPARRSSSPATGSGRVFHDASKPTQAHPSVEHLIDEYSVKSVLDRETDDYGTIAKLVTLYRFAIANYSNPLSELLLEALAAMEAAETEEH